jgi:hypothetical protein
MPSKGFAGSVVQGFLGGEQVWSDERRCALGC